jgi:hypothetical protein
MSALLETRAAAYPAVSGISPHGARKSRFLQRRAPGGRESTPHRTTYFSHASVTFLNPIKFRSFSIHSMEGGNIFC